MEKSNPDTAVESMDQLNLAFIAGVANEILRTMHELRTTPLTRHSILTTAFVNNLKQMLRDSPPEHFEDNRSTAILLLEKVLEDVKTIQPGAPNARGSEDGSSLPRPEGSSN